MTQPSIMLSKFAMKKQLERTPHGEFRQRLLIAKHNGLDDIDRYTVTPKPKLEISEQEYQEAFEESQDSGERVDEEEEPWP